ncbi:hypothetical protein, partial [Hymenobacter agri]
SWRRNGSSAAGNGGSAGAAFRPTGTSSSISATAFRANNPGRIINSYQLILYQRYENESHVHALVPFQIALFFDYRCE